MAEEAERKRLLTEKAKLSPVDMFRTATEEYSAWDEQGISTKDAQGEEIAKGKRPSRYLSLVSLNTLGWLHSYFGTFAKEFYKVARIQMNT